MKLFQNEKSLFHFCWNYYSLIIGLNSSYPFTNFTLSWAFFAQNYTLINRRGRYGQLIGPICLWIKTKSTLEWIVFSYFDYFSYIVSFTCNYLTGFFSCKDAIFKTPLSSYFFTVFTGKSVNLIQMKST